MRWLLILFWFLIASGFSDTAFSQSRWNQVQFEIVADTFTQVSSSLLNSQKPFESETCFEFDQQSNTLFGISKKDVRSNYYVYSVDIENMNLELVLSTYDSVSNIMRTADSKIYAILHGDSSDQVIVSDNVNPGWKSIIERPVLSDFYVGRSQIFIITGQDKYNLNFETTDLKNQKNKLIAENCGQEIYQLNEENILFFECFSENYKYIKKYSITAKTSQIITYVPPSTTNYTYNDGILYMTDGQNLNRFDVLSSSDWTPLYLHPTSNINSISQITATAPNKILIRHD